jgi:hypothetical protein
MATITTVRGRYGFSPPLLAGMAFCAAVAGTPSTPDAQMVVQTPIDSARITFSGVLYLNYQYRLHPSGGVNRFDVDRAYLNVAGPLGNRISFRLTSDVYQVTADTANRSWQLRAKYAYAQYDVSQHASWPAWVRLGMLQNMFIDHDEEYWPRWLSPAVTDRQGYFSSADVGVLARVGLPRRKGELLGTIVNGPGFASREIDRFKDFGARLSITPLAQETGSPWRTLTFALWGYRGALASRFAEGGTDQVGPVGSALRRDRWGVFTAVAHPRATMSIQHARRIDEGERGENTATDPRLVTDSTGSVTASYLVLQPFTGAASRVSLIARWDRVDRHVEVGRRHDLVIGGVAWTFGPGRSVALDLQNTYPRDGNTTPPNRTIFLHTQTRF